YSCDHFRWIASKWCRDYTMTHKRCESNITHFEYRYVAELCGECKSKELPPWMGLIKWSKKSVY
ncbi:uncharacterized protein P884DRAFT_192434, partial [Thermothelomyces heterothallicus CBS 202.75]|uniref:uncharacterized protein n=1 Tax=Thermothelomyces heterothallicus CBS 202.75 TaxID=1149848 RepID=UPI0037437B76